ncbi:hypothetical protein [Desulfofundulus salinus]|uniref:Uncharacterized protein n=1 Tax=Desulfofundulus salinus TaxID=2419843 RepID=A0A494WR68_9FIRM|nr:hypothetical protein [Desulfofundulus salinum]RKO65679.1 hypothetical protein D7024_00985 [Desulfofundulus salinum]
MSSIIMKYRYVFASIVLAVALLATVALITGASSDSDPAVIYESALRKEELPKMNEFNGKAFIQNEMGAQFDLSDLRLRAQLPVNLDSSNFWQDIKFQLKTPKKSVPVTIIPEESNMQSGTLSNGDIIRWGAITGNISIAAGKPQTVVIGVFEIPSQQKASFTFALHAGNGNPPVALSFGNLTPNEEILQIIKGGKE